MFEKEEEEWFEKLKQAKVPYTNENVNKYLHKAFKDGAEFGYNKANEWHLERNCTSKGDKRIMTKLEALAKDCIENHTHKLVDKPTKQDIYLREESILFKGIDNLKSVLQNLKHRLRNS